MNFQDPDTVTGGVAPATLDKNMSLYAVMNDRLINSLSAAIAQATTRSSAEAASRYMDPGFRLGVAGGARILTGYNPADLMRGISGSLSGAMPSFNMPIGGQGTGVNARMGGGTFMGQGTLTDVFTQNVYDHIQKNYFNQLGLAKMSKTFGMTKSQMGDVFNVMGQRGMLAGISAGTLTEDKKTGETVLQTSEKSFARIDEQFRKTSQVLGVVKKMFGSNGSMSELANIAEQATGITMGPGSIGAVLRRLQNISTFAATTGLSTRTAQQLIGASSESVSQFGRGMAGALASGAAKSTGVAFRSAQVAAGLANERGDYIAPKDVQEMQQTETVLRGQLLEENPLLVESMFVLQNTKTLKPEEAAKIQAAITRFQKAGTRQEQGEASAAMRAAIESSTRTQAGVLTEKMGGVKNVLKNLAPETQQQLSDVLGENLTNRGVNVLSDLAGSTQMIERAFGQGSFTAEQAGQAGMALMGGLSAQTRNELMGYLKEGNKNKALALLESKTKMLEGANLGPGAKILQQMITQDNIGSNQFFREMESQSASLPTMMTTISAEDKIAQDHLDARRRVSNIFDTSLIEKPGTIESVIRNTLGQTDIGNEEKMRYLVAAGANKKDKGYRTFDMNKIGQTADEARNLQDVLGSYDVNLFEKFKVKQDDYEGLAKAIGNNKDALYGILADKGVVGAQMPKGQIGLAYKSAADASTKNLERAQMAKTELVMEGVSTSDPRFEEKLKERMTQLGAERTDKFNPEEAMRKQAKSAERFAKAYSRDDVLQETLKNPDSQRFKDLEQLQKTNPDLLDPMFKAAKSRVMNSDENKEAKERKLQQLNDLQDRLKEAKGNNMIGIVEIRGDKTFMKQYKK